jgi:bifunctional DNA-binding transcriptional regulator/antitoxin component of YhaV-PrlF toxin-antitoxin module
MQVMKAGQLVVPEKVRKLVSPETGCDFVLVNEPEPQTLVIFLPKEKGQPCSSMNAFEAKWGDKLKIPS